jgi:hypothetical protein
MLSARPGPLNPGAMYLLQHHPMRPSRAAGSFFGPTRLCAQCLVSDPAVRKRTVCEPPHSRRSAFMGLRPSHLELKTL